MSVASQRCLFAAGVGLILGALLHVVALIGGPGWLAFVGAPPLVVLSAQEGTWLAPVTTLGITALLLVWAAYAFSGAGLLGRLPFLKWVLIAVAFVLILRGVLVVPMAAQANFAVPFDLFHVAASLGVLVLGGLLAIGVRSLSPAA